MKKISLILLVITLLSSFTLVACGNKNEETEKGNCIFCGKELSEESNVSDVLKNSLCEECFANTKMLDISFDLESAEMSEDEKNTICTATIRCNLDELMDSTKTAAGSLSDAVIKNVRITAKFEFLDKDGVVVDCVEVYDEASEYHHNQRITIVGKTLKTKGAVSCNVTVEDKMITNK